MALRPLSSFLMAGVLSLILLLTIITFDGLIRRRLIEENLTIVDVAGNTTKAAGKMVLRQESEGGAIRSEDHYCCDITSKPTPDPYVIYAHGKFYMTFTANNRIPMWDSGSLLDFYEKPHVGAVWWPPQDSDYSERLWAPELHALNGRWYIYFAAQDPKKGNKSHRSYVLGGPPESRDPHGGPWEFLGPIAGMDQSQWSIDGTVFKHENQVYFVYSGWDLVDPRESEQKLYILRLSDPTTAATPPIAISKPDNDWEFSGKAGINEGPQWLTSPDASWQGLVYSCAGSWTKSYKMATLQLIGTDPLDPSCWQKSAKPLLQNRPDGQGPYGPGHGNFLQAGNETVALFHATDGPNEGSRNRKCRMQRVDWTAEGPDMGYFVGESSRDLGRLAARSEDSERHGSVLRDLAQALTGH